ncbi:MAG: glycosyltransferase family 39 protein [Planctomycetota bacterium]
MAALGWAALGMAATFDGPFDQGWLGHNGARYAQIARNYNRIGLLADRGAPRLDAGVPDEEHPDVYAHHPPALAMTIALMSRLVGEGEMAARLVPSLATLLMLVVLAVIVRREAGLEVAALTVLATVAQPMVSVYGAHVDVQGAPVLCASMFVLLAYQRYLAGGGMLPVLISAVVASAFDWYGLYAPVACALHLFVVDRRRRRVAVGLAGFAIAMFSAWLVWLLTLPGMSFVRLERAAGIRGVTVLLGQVDRLPQALAEWYASTEALMPGWLWLLSVAVLVLCGVVGQSEARASRLQFEQPAESRTLGRRGLLALLLLPPLVHGVLFPAGLLVHSYWLFALPPALGLAVGLLASRLRPALATVAVAVLLWPGYQSAQVLLSQRDDLYVRVGREIARRADPGDVVLTNFDCNPLIDSAADPMADQYLLFRPAVTYYSDRVVRGRIGSSAALEDALRRRPDSRWFLETPWPTPMSSELSTALSHLASAPPEGVPGQPLVRWHRLAP